MVVEEIIERHWLFSWGWQVHEKVALIILPEFHQLKRSLGADAKVLTHEHSCHHDIVFPLFVRLNTFVEVLSPIDWLIEDLLDAKSLHLLLILEDVIKDALSDRIEIVLVDFIEHGIDQVLDSLLLDGVKIPRNQLDDVCQPVLSDWSNHVN